MKGQHIPCSCVSVQDLVSSSLQTSLITITRAVSYSGPHKQIRWLIFVSFYRQYF